MHGISCFGAGLFVFWAEGVDATLPLNFGHITSASLILWKIVEASVAFPAAKANRQSSTAWPERRKCTDLSG
jgi:hypothetical protein